MEVIQDNHSDFESNENRSILTSCSVSSSKLNPHKLSWETEGWTAGEAGAGWREAGGYSRGADASKGAVQMAPLLDWCL